MLLRAGRPALLLLALGACGPGPATTTGDSSSSGEPATSAGTTGGGSAGTTMTPTTTLGSMTGTGTTTGTTGTTTGTTTTTTGTTTGDNNSSGSEGTAGTGGVEGCGGVELFQDQEATVQAGLEKCPDGAIHRHTAAQCAVSLVPEPCTKPDQPCSQQDACDELGDGQCHEFYNTYCRCAYPCESDADCAAGAACLCGSGVVVEQGFDVAIVLPQCYPGNCRTDADCRGSLRCNLSPNICRNGYDSLFCETPADECVSGQDCIDKQLGDRCSFSSDEQRWVCDLFAFCE